MSYPCDGPMHDGTPVEATFSITAFKDQTVQFMCPLCLSVMGYAMGVEAGLWPDGLLQALEETMDLPEAEPTAAADVTDAADDPVELAKAPADSEPRVDVSDPAPY